MSKQNPDPKLYEKRETVRQYTKDNVNTLLDDPKKFFSGLDVSFTTKGYITKTYNQNIIDNIKGLLPKGNLVDIIRDLVS